MMRDAEALVALFRAAFPAIDFEIAWDSDTVNARALYGQPRKRVRLYGGLVRHRMVEKEGLALTLAHEVGHLLGGRPRDLYHHWLSCEGVADYWAARYGLRRIWPEADFAVRLRLGARQLINLQYREFNKPPAYRRRRGDDGRFPCLVTLPPSCRLQTWMAGMRKLPKPDCAC